MNPSPLEQLIENNEAGAIETLLKEQAQLASQTTTHGISPLLLAAYYERPDIAGIIADALPSLHLIEACALGRFEDVTLAIYKYPEQLNEHGENGFTPLGTACYFAHEEIVRFLIMKGADVNIASKNGYHVYPIHSAVAANHLSITRLLFEAGAYPNVCQKSGMAPLHSAAALGNIDLIILLLEHGAEVGLRMEGGKLPADLAAEKGFTEIAEILREDD